MSFPRYPKTKPSGVDWLGDVPEHWARVRVKHLFDIGRGRVISLEDAKEDGTYPVFSSQTTNDGCLGYLETFDFDCDQLTWTTDGANAGTVFLRRGKHNCTNVCGTLQVKQTAEFSLTFGLHYLSFAAQFHKRPDTNGAKIMNGEMAEITTLVPPPSEQTAIASFLDHETGKIDVLVEEQRRLIALLKEKRQAVISHAVTKGLNPLAPMKPSGVEWLGDVPVHWEVKRIANLFSEVVEAGTEDLPILSVSIHHGVSDKEIDEEDMDRKVTRSEDRSKYKKVAPDDLVYNMMRAWQGGFGTVTVEGMVSPAYVVARPRLELETLYVENLLRTPQATEQMRRHSRGITDFRLRLYWDEFKNIKVPVPPQNEAEAICAKIREMEHQFSQMSATCGIAIDLLQERRTALISAAVTGKIDVRSFHHG